MHNTPTFWKYNNNLKQKIAFKCTKSPHVRTMNVNDIAHSYRPILIIKRVFDFLFSGAYPTIKSHNKCSQRGFCVFVPPSITRKTCSSVHMARGGIPIVDHKNACIIIKYDRIVPEVLNTFARHIMISFMKLYIREAVSKTFSQRISSPLFQLLKATD